MSWKVHETDVRTVNEHWMNGERTEEGAAMSITDKLRKWVNERFVGLFSSEWVSDLNAIADRIDVEYAAYRAAVNAMPKEYVKLPVDADGVPIHVGDELDGYGKMHRVHQLNLYTDGDWSLVDERGDIHYCDMAAFTHVKPDSWERIIADAMLGAERDGAPDTYSDCLAELVERCRRLAGDAE